MFFLLILYLLVCHFLQVTIHRPVKSGRGLEQLQEYDGFYRHASYSYHNLPDRYRKKYKLASRFVHLVQSKTIKVSQAVNSVSQCVCVCVYVFTVLSVVYLYSSSSIQQQCTDVGQIRFNYHPFRTRVLLVLSVCPAWLKTDCGGMEKVGGVRRTAAPYTPRRWYGGW